MKDNQEDVEASILNKFNNYSTIYHGKKIPVYRAKLHFSVKYSAYFFFYAIRIRLWY